MLSYSGAVGITTRTVTETLVDWHCGKCGDQGDRDRSGLTLWQVWRPTRQKQKVKLKQDPFSFQEAGPEVSTHPTPICLSSILEKQNKTKNKNKILNAPLPICLSSNVSTVCVTKRRSARWVKLSSAVSRSHTFTARELWLNRVHRVSSQLTDTKLLNGRDCQA